MRFAVHRTAVQQVQPPTPLRPVQPAIITNIVGVKWYRLRCRLGCSTATASQRLIVPAFARASVRPTQRAMRLSGPRCSAICPIKCGGKYETNFYIIFYNYAVCIIWRRTVHVVSHGLCCCCGIVYGNREQHVSQWIYIRRYGGQLPDSITRRVVYYVCANRGNLYRQQWFI